MAFKKGLWFRDFQPLRVSTEFTARHKIIDRLYQNRVYLDRIYLDRLYFDRVYRLPYRLERLHPAISYYSAKFEEPFVYKLIQKCSRATAGWKLKNNLIS